MLQFNSVQAEDLRFVVSFLINIRDQDEEGLLIAANAYILIGYWFECSAIRGQLPLKACLTIHKAVILANNGAVKANVGTGVLLRK